MRDIVEILESTKVAYVCNFRAFLHLQCCIHDHVACLQWHVALCPLGAGKLGISRTNHYFLIPGSILSNLHAEMLVLLAWELHFRKKCAPASARCVLFEAGFRASKTLFFLFSKRPGISGVPTRNAHQI